MPGYKALLVDKDTMRVCSTLFGRTELAEHSVVHVERLDSSDSKQHLELKVGPWQHLSQLLSQHSTALRAEHAAPGRAQHVTTQQSQRSSAHKQRPAMTESAEPWSLGLCSRSRVAHNSSMQQQMLPAANPATHHLHTVHVMPLTVTSFCCLGCRPSALCGPLGRM